jgi:hypothetical protein
VIFAGIYEGIFVFSAAEGYAGQHHTDCRRPEPPSRNRFGGWLFSGVWVLDVCGSMWIGESFFGGVMVRESLLTMGGKIAGQFST